MAKQKKFYAYSIGCRSGITESWPECEGIVKGRNARFKGFATKKEAEEWLEEGADYSYKPSGHLEDGIYFDAGTGRGNGVEVRVTDKTGRSLLPETLSREELNEYENYPMPSATNNHGELTGLYLALKIAEKSGKKKIFGDSRLVIEYWSRGIINSASLLEETVNLSKRVTLMRKKFEDNGGKVHFISGDVNPADLGFHR